MKGYEEGDLLFVVGNNEEIIPVKVIKVQEKHPAQETLLYFEVIDDRQKLPPNKKKCRMKDTGYNKGFVFKERQNALDYLDIIKRDGTFTMASVVTHKMSRNVSRGQQVFTDPYFNVSTIEQAKEAATAKAIDYTQSVMISAMLLAMNSVLGVGPSRANRVIDEINQWVEKVDMKEITPEELRKKAFAKMKVDQ